MNIKINPTKITALLGLFYALFALSNLPTTCWAAGEAFVVVDKANWKVKGVNVIGRGQSVWLQVLCEEGVVMLSQLPRQNGTYDIRSTPRQEGRPPAAKGWMHPRAKDGDFLAWDSNDKERDSEGQASGDIDLTVNGDGSLSGAFGFVGRRGENGGEKVEVSVSFSNASSN